MNSRDSNDKQQSYYNSALKHTSIDDDHVLSLQRSSTSQAAAVYVL